MTIRAVYPSTVPDENPEVDRGTIDEQIHDAKRGVAILATCIVQTLQEGDPTFQARFLKRLEDAYSATREDTDSPALDRLELIKWVKQMLTGWSDISGQGKPFLS
ncbi:hypothetical protein [Aquamicrobium sp. LC103]|uniref:hypothetical protein n=1 Tax=Aquamicrobium sp. LC103 TaxID=1120658 RepID=UPI00069B28AF|nr:hypothetical protein [Aquamicrobium sp. LC103]TKT79992.1 hypothetical protein XW59_006420 [Aquamicrobium sp. LC103]